MINNDGHENCDHNEDNDGDGDDLDDGGDERSEKLLVSNRQSTFDRQLDSGHLGRFGSQVCQIEINENKTTANKQKNAQHDGYFVESY